VLLRKGNIKGDVMFLKTKKASTDVQIPLPEELVDRHRRHTSSGRT
jgi:hypothetical protein